MIARYALIYEEPGTPLLFRSLDREAFDFFEARPLLPQVVRAVALIHRKNGSVNACKAVDVAKDLENALRTVARTPSLSVRPLRWEYRETGTFKDPGGQETKVVEHVLVDIETALIVDFPRGEAFP